jgi:hypothetical protein
MGVESLTGDRFAPIDARLLVLKWMVGFVIALNLFILVSVFVR